ncbi:putative Cystatin domain-containing protein [Dioscorea sansibarensis]
MGGIETIQKKLFSPSTLPLLNPNTSPPMAATAEIKDVEINLKIDSIFTYLAKFAVQVHNQKENAHLAFIKIVKVTIEPVTEGTIYVITLEVSNLGIKQLYEAKVWVKLSTGYKELLDFNHVVG